MHGHLNLKLILLVHILKFLTDLRGGELTVMYGDRHKSVRLLTDKNSKA
jgi:hypothetical protein